MPLVFDGVQCKNLFHIQTVVSNADALLLCRMVKVCILTSVIIRIKRIDRDDVR